MHKKKLRITRETLRTLDLRQVSGGQSQGGACDNTQGKTQCDLQGCALVCSDSCNICDTTGVPTAMGTCLCTT